uniref:Uncharacterized protein n=1 Tax=Gasterosteus aculeatus TaxID=69293 RepID=G3NZX4_GASAC
IRSLRREAPAASVHSRRPLIYLCEWFAGPTGDPFKRPRRREANLHWVTCDDDAPPNRWITLHSHEIVVVVVVVIFFYSMCPFGSCSSPVKSWW